MIYYILYLVINKNKLKIGITTSKNAYNRFCLMERDFGSCDFKNSFYITSKKQEEINNLEQLLHRSFYGNNKPLKVGAGKTEWFSSSVLSDTIKHIEFLKKTNNNFKGISSPIKDIESIYKRKRRHKEESSLLKFFVGSYNITLAFLSLSIIALTVYVSS